MNRLTGDLRYGFRMLLRTPALSVVAILTIGLGVGLTTHVFSAVYGSVIRGLPVRAPDRLMIVGEVERDAEPGNWMPMPLRDYLDFEDRQTSFESLEAGTSGTVYIAGEAGSPERYDGTFVTAGALSSLGVPPVLGRTFQEGDDVPGTAGTVVLGYDVWRNRYAGDPDVVGRSVRVNGEAMTVVGVMPEGFRWPFDHEVWVAHRVDPETLGRREGWMQVVGHLKEGVSREAAQAEMAAILETIGRDHPDEYDNLTATVMPYAEAYMPPQITAVLWLQLGAVFGVLLVACANVANLLLARAAVRQREVAVRTALGASRWAVVRQLLAEAVVLGLAGGAVGLLLAHFGTLAFNLSIADIQKPYWIDIRTDWAALLFTVVVTLAAAVIAGTIPALRASGGNVADVLRDEARGSSSLRLGRLSTVLVVGQLAVSCALLIAAGFMIRSVINTNTLDMGFEPAGIMTARVGLFETDYPDADSRQRFFRDLVDGLRGSPAVSRAGLVSHLPSAGAMRARFAVEGESYSVEDDYPVTGLSTITDGYFEAMGVGLVRGRDFRPSETWGDGEPVAIVNRSFAEKFFPGRDPVGRAVRLGTSGSERPWLRIVGVVPDLYVGGNVGGIGDDRVDPELLYVPIHELDPRFLSIAMRSQGPPESLAQAARRVVAGLDPNLPLYWVRTMEKTLDDSIWVFKIFGSLFTIFGLSALFLAAVGLYGVMDFSVARRRQEMGVRMALGAGSREIYGLVFRRVFVQLGVGMALGLGMGYALSQPLRAVMFGVETFDPVVYGVIVATLAATAVIASFFPANRAARVDPATALRSD